MSTVSATSDQGILDQLRRRPQNVAQLAAATQVTATAVRQRLTRLMAQGLIERAATPAGRGRPSHCYSLTTAGRSHAGANYDDLAQALWSEIRAIDNPEVQRGLLKRISQRLAAMYDKMVDGAQPVERMRALSRMFAERDIPFEVEMQQELPVLTALACPYPTLAEQDRSVCAMERMLFSELVGQNVRLTECRLDGGSCCRFETN